MTTRFSSSIVLGLALAALPGCADHFPVRNVDPSTPGRVRALSPESQDVDQVANQMLRSLIETPSIKNAPAPPTIAMLPMTNNTRHAFNQEVFTSLLKARLNSKAAGKMTFVGRDIMSDIKAEREGKRQGELDYDPSKRVKSVAGVDYFLKGRVDGLSNASGQGQSDYYVYTFKLVDAESSVELWEEPFEIKKEGRDDVVYN